MAGPVRLTVPLSNLAIVAMRTEQVEVRLHTSLRSGFAEYSLREIHAVQ
jgi:hypothetical protein